MGVNEREGARTLNQWLKRPAPRNRFSHPSELAIPGQTFVDAVLTRLLGVALLALALSSFRGWRAKQRSEVEILIQTEAAFCILGVVAFIAGFILIERATPIIG